MSVLQGVARGMAYMHAQRLCHGDLNPANILLKVCRHPSLTLPHTFRWLKPMKFGKQEVNVLFLYVVPCRHSAWYHCALNEQRSAD